ncbi:MAG: RNA pyrophosphohydrolase [Rhodobacteraceae bacterium]|nr:RNA pyrophosphohydrolase [Paracoccaceae bacterium]
MTADPGTLPYRPCVGIVLANPAGLVFAGQRIDTPGAWQMPQGGIDEGETPEAAAARELREETGVPAELARIEACTPNWLTYDLPTELLGRVWGGRFRGQKQLWFLMRFSGQDSDIRLDDGHPEFSTWAWMAPEAVTEAIVPFKRDIYRQVFGALGPLL